jgi:hypothetical protein
MPRQTASGDGSRPEPGLDRGGVGGEFFGVYLSFQVWAFTSQPGQQIGPRITLPRMTSHHIMIRSRLEISAEPLLAAFKCFPQRSFGFGSLADACQ